jgi:hypothetical protein
MSIFSIKNSLIYLINKKIIGNLKVNRKRKMSEQSNVLENPIGDFYECLRLGPFLTSLDIKELCKKIDIRICNIETSIDNHNAVKKGILTESNVTIDKSSIELLEAEKIKQEQNLELLKSWALNK